MTRSKLTRAKDADSGKLRIGDDWNAIRIIALSQSNPLKAIAEFVENAIDAHAKTITITRGREHGEHSLTVKDDGDGAGLQGEFGIGLLSFWTIGETLSMTSTGADQRVYQMVMNKGDPRYTVTPRRVLFGERGTELKVSPLLEGVRAFSGEKIQWYLASELRAIQRAFREALLALPPEEYDWLGIIYLIP